MKRIVSAACLLFCVHCHKPGEEKARQLSEPPPPPQLQLPPEKENEAEGFRVVAGRPQGKLVGAVHPTLTFSEPVVSLATLEQGDPGKGLQIQPAVKGRWHWLGSASVDSINED